MEAAVTITRTYELPDGGTVTVTASGIDADANILRPEVAVAMAERLVCLAKDIRGDNDGLHNVE